MRALENPSIHEPLAAVEKTSKYADALRLLQEKTPEIDPSLNKNAA